eukprot:TRINITY_DN35108_c0_g1_i2.p2 TRINITY_DN35108_c0_g1~~TRINITY_DN35108_c0_g1_i2.p2  ORF type:complete len:109 (-),score=6.18 TRINITY_DN35108_c0_g1_i2:4-330(-)
MKHVPLAAFAVAPVIMQLVEADLIAVTHDHVRQRPLGGEPPRLPVEIHPNVRTIQRHALAVPDAPLPLDAKGKEPDEKKKRVIGGIEEKEECKKRQRGRKENRKKRTT